jgi:hypothetical protein
MVVFEEEGDETVITARDGDEERVRGQDFEVKRGSVELVDVGSSVDQPLNDWDDIAVIVFIPELEPE